MRPRSLSLVALLAVGLAAGCVSLPYRAHPAFNERAPEINTVALLPPDVKVYKLTAGGITELIDEWSEKARSNVVSSILKKLPEERAFILQRFDPGGFPDAAQELEEARPLFEAVASSALTHTYQEETKFATKRERFEYSLGPLLSLAEATEADALLFVYARDHVSTGGRIALNVFAVLVGLATGVVVIPGGGPTAIVTALVDARTGDVLWFNVRGSGGAHDLREAASAEELLGQVFDDLAQVPAVGKGADRKTE